MHEQADGMELTSRVLGRTWLSGLPRFHKAYETAAGRVIVLYLFRFERAGTTQLFQLSSYGATLSVSAAIVGFRLFIGQFRSVDLGLFRLLFIAAASVFFADVSL